MLGRLLAVSIGAAIGIVSVSASGIQPPYANIEVLLFMILAVTIWGEK